MKSGLDILPTVHRFSPAFFSFASSGISVRPGVLLLLFYSSLPFLSLLFCWVLKMSTTAVVKYARVRFFLFLLNYLTFWIFIVMRLLMFSAPTSVSRELHFLSFLSGTSITNLLPLPANVVHLPSPYLSTFLNPCTKVAVMLTVYSSSQLFADDARGISPV